MNDSGQPLLHSVFLTLSTPVLQNDSCITYNTVCSKALSYMNTCLFVPTPIPMDDFRNVLTLSPLSPVEIARRFGISRSNLMGLLRGNRTLSDDRLLQLVKWVRLVGANTLHLDSGIHFW